jgi:peptidoglycan/xylan/chitin deacetylase (PgdA/CDA1 family)
MRPCTLLVACALLGQIAAGSPAGLRRVAITIDDGPVVGEPEDLEAFQRVSRGLIDSLRAEGAPATIFVNERQLNVPGQRDGRASVLEWWLDAGFDLGNHTYSHPSLNAVPFRVFADDVVKGEVVSRPLLEKRGRRLLWFRYPFLHSGTTPEVHEQILAFLAERGYRAAPVTVDYADYAFAGVYRSQLRGGAADVAAKIGEAYLAQVDAGFEYAERASVDVFGREIAQILLIHCNELNARTLRESLARIRARGYQFITLDEAMRDPAYERPDTFAGPGGTWLSRSAAVLGRTITVARPPMPQWMTELSARGNRSNQ